MSFKENSEPMDFFDLFDRIRANDGSAIIKPFHDLNLRSNLHFSPTILPTNVYTEDNTIHMLISVAGCTKEDVSVSLKSGQLIVSAKFETDESRKYIINEFAFAQKRTYIVPKNVKAEDITIDYNNGLLHIQFPANKEDETVKINF